MEVGSKVEFLFKDGIPLVGTVEVLLDFGGGDVEVEIESFMEESGKEMGE